MNVLRFLGNSFVRRLCKQDFDYQTFRRHNERPIELEFVFRVIRQLCPRTVLDVGSGQSALPALVRNCGCIVTATDNIRDYWPQGMVNRHWWIVDDDISRSRLKAGSFDLVLCVSTLEHIQDHRGAVANMLRLAKPGGYLVITCPYTDANYVENVFELDGVREEFKNEPYICRSYSSRELYEWLSDSGAELIVQEFWQIDTGRCHGQGQWLFPAATASRETLHQLTCLLIRATSRIVDPERP